MWWGGCACYCDGQHEPGSPKQQDTEFVLVIPTRTSEPGEADGQCPSTDASPSKCSQTPGMERWCEESSPKPIDISDSVFGDEEADCSSAGKSRASTDATTASSCSSKPSTSPKHGHSDAVDVNGSDVLAGKDAAVTPGPLARLLPSNCVTSFSALEAAFPQAPAAELRRFARAYPRSKDALRSYKSYLLWRADGGRPEVVSKGLSMVPADWIDGSAVCGLAKDGTGVVFVQGARYDAKIDLQLYTQAVCRVVDEMLPADSEGQITALLDVRPSRGWPNPSPMEIVPFVRDLVKVIMSNYPERLKRAIVYPLPAGLVTFANFLLMVMDSSVRQKIQLVPDKDFLEHLREHITQDNLPERTRSRHQGL